MNRILRVMTEVLSVTGNNITGDVLIDLDKFALKEMGVKHIGDRLNLATNIQHLRVEEMRAAHTHVTVSETSWHYETEY